MSRDENRPSPDQLLAALQSEEKRRSLGRLTVFLGMAAGVGKTYAMLQHAHQMVAQGANLVVGWVDTHGRAETAALLKGLEIFPRRQINHRGIILDEFDLDGILKLHPQIVLVDELAHTNAPGSRHTKRYLDVAELLNAGIDVFTTINIQHLESRAGTVQEITGAKVQETVPDTFLDQADEVILIDLAPEELQRRLKAGRVYPAERAEAAALNFFKKGNLTALREMALRLAAERVDRELRSFKIMHGIEKTWKSGNRLLVAIYASPYSETLIRWTRRLADSMDATWIGVYVENDRSLTDDEKDLLTRNIALAGRLGGEVILTRDNDVVSGLLRAAKQNNVTQIIVGKSQRNYFSQLLRGGSLIEKLIKKSGDIDVYVVSTERNPDTNLKPPTKKPHRHLVFPWEEIGWVCAIAVLTWILAAWLEPYLGYLMIGMIFLISVCLSGLILSRSSVFVLAVLFAFIHNFFFIPPLYTFTIGRPEDILTLTMYFAAAASLGRLMSRLKQKENILRQRETQAISLYSMVKDLAAATTVDEIVAASVRRLGSALEASVSVILDQDHELKVHPKSDFNPEKKELAVAEWSRKHGRRAGRFTDTLPSSSATYFPLQGRDAALGAVGVQFKGKEILEADEIILAETFARQIAAALERENYHERSRQFEIITKTEKLYRILLDSVSHELKTPLSTIEGSASAILDPLSSGNSKAVVQLATEILTSTEQLQRLVENLLDMTRIESGMLKPKRELCDAEDLIGSALRPIEMPARKGEIKITLANDLLPIRCDQVLLVQALTNIFHNALTYTPPGSPIEVNAQQRDPTHAEIVIRDHGPGLPPDNPSQVLHKFYRGQPERTGGVGLGLSIAKGFIELQGGTLQAENHTGGGAVFRVMMPTEDIS